MAYRLDEDRGGQNARRNCRTDDEAISERLSFGPLLHGNAETSYIARIYQANGGTGHVTDGVHTMTGSEKS